ncbi:MAG: FKBP-type peptidyl-prolyl cis-trans isomerase [Chitinophagaceae bacterium]
MNNLKLMTGALLACAMIASCGKTSFKKTPGGMPYKLYKGKDTQTIKAGDYIQVSFTTKVNDSVLFTTADNPLPFIQFVSNQVRPYDISEILQQMHVGDSVVATQMVDTFIKRSPNSVPPQFRNGDKITMYFKILGKYASDSAARTAFETASKQLVEKESKDIEKYLADKKITTVKTKSGAYAEILQEGTGPKADSGMQAAVMYTGSTWAGTRFDSNQDKSFGHTDPYTFVTGTGGAVRGFDEGVMLLAKGGKARLYVPSMLGYGPDGNPPRIKPFEKLIFDIEVVDVQTPQAPKQPQQLPLPQNVDAAQPKNK